MQTLTCHLDDTLVRPQLHAWSPLRFGYQCVTEGLSRLKHVLRSNAAIVTLAVWRIGCFVLSFCVCAVRLGDELWRVVRWPLSVCVLTTCVHVPHGTSDWG